MDMGTMYSPIMMTLELGEVPEYKTCKAAKAILICQHWCAAYPACLHWMIEFPQRTCHISGEGAKRLHPVFKHIAGPPTCSRDYDGDADAAIEAFLDGSPAAQLAGERALTLLPTVAAGAM